LKEALAERDRKQRERTTSNAAHGFPAYTLTCLLHLKGYGTYPAEATFGCSLLTL
jgi:hypothetical protein